MTTYALDAARAVFERLGDLLAYSRFLGEVPIGTAAEAPHVICYPSTPSPVARHLGGQSGRWVGLVSVVCVSNHALGAVKVAAEVAALLDGWRLPVVGAGLVRCTVGPTIRDPDMAAGYRWSATVQASYYLTR